MARSKQRRNKPYRPKWNGDGAKLRTKPWKVELVYRPIYQIIDQLERDGTVDVVSNGAAVFVDPKNGGLYDTYAAITGLIDAHEIHERRQGRDLNMTPLRELANKLKSGDPVFDEDTKAARAALDRMKAEDLQMTLDYADQLVKDFQISEELQKVAANDAGRAVA